MLQNRRRCCQKRTKRRTAFSSARRFLPVNLHQLFDFRRSERFPPIRSAVWAKLYQDSSNPSPSGIQELHANCIAFAMQGLAVSHPGPGTKLSAARCKHQ